MDFVIRTTTELGEGTKPIRDESDLPAVYYETISLYALTTTNTSTPHVSSKRRKSPSGIRSGLISCAGALLNDCYGRLTGLRKY